jgi:cardiolipin synthase
VVERSNLPFWVTVVLIVLDFGIKAIALGLVPERRRPSSAMAWLLLIFFVPGLGLLLFFLLGSTFVNRRRRRIQAQAGMIVLQNNVYPSLPATATGPDWLRGSLTLNAKLGWLDPVAGNRIELYTDYDASIAAMAAAVDRAERFIHVEFSIVAWDDVTDPLFTALAAAAQRGVKVRLLYDHLASLGVDGYADLLNRLEATGIEHHAMLPLQPLKRRWRRPDLRNHRKLLVVDGLVGFGGSQNLIHPSYHKPKHERAGGAGRS